MYTAAIVTELILILLVAVAIVIVLVLRADGSNGKGDSTFRIEAPPLDKSNERSRPGTRTDLPPYVETDEDRVRRRALNEERRQEGRAGSTERRPVRPISHRRRPSKGFEIPERFVVLDLETTGLSAHYNEIIEIGAISVDMRATERATFQTLVRPSVPVPKNITALTGITQDMIDRDGVDLTTALTRFVSFIGELPLVAFNAPFDISFLEAAAEKCGLSISNSHCCALALARRAWPGLPSYKLSELAKMGNLPLDDAHRSLGDCMRAANIYLAAASTLSGTVGHTYPRTPFSAG